MAITQSNWDIKYDTFRVPTVGANLNFRMFTETDQTNSNNSIEKSLLQFLRLNQMPIRYRDAGGNILISNYGDANYNTITLKDFNLLTLNAPIDSTLYEQKVTLLPTQSNEFRGFPRAVVKNAKVLFTNTTVFPKELQLRLSWENKLKYPYDLRLAIEYYGAANAEVFSDTAWTTAGKPKAEVYVDLTQGSGQALMTVFAQNMIPNGYSAGNYLNSGRFIWRWAEDNYYTIEDALDISYNATQTQAPYYDVTYVAPVWYNMTFTNWLSSNALEYNSMLNGNYVENVAGNQQTTYLARSSSDSKLYYGSGSLGNLQQGAQYSTAASAYVAFDYSVVEMGVMRAGGIIKLVNGVVDNIVYSPL